MTICFLINGFLKKGNAPLNGTIVQAYNLAYSLAAKGHRVHYISLSSSIKQYYSEKIDNIILHWIPDNSKYVSFISVINRYSKILNEIAPDIVYTRGRSYLNYICGLYAKRTGKKFLWASNGDDGCRKWKFTSKIFKTKKNPFKKALYLPFCLIEDLMVHNGIKKAELVVNQNNQQKSDLLKYFNKVGIIIKSGHIIHDVNLADKKNIVLWLATLSPSKQPELFIEIAKQFSDLKNWEFLLIGGSSDTNYVTHIHNKCNTIGNIHFITGIPYEKTNEYFAKASIFINTSKFEAEGLPNTFVQSWFNGTVVLSLNHNPDGDLDNFKVGKCADGDFNRLAEITKEFIGNKELLKEYSKNSIEYSNKFYNIKEIVNQYLKLFRSV